jgi:hypothetical protein
MSAASAAPTDEQVSAGCAACLCSAKSCSDRNKSSATLV